MDKSLTFVFNASTLDDLYKSTFDKANDGTMKSVYAQWAKPLGQFQSVTHSRAAFINVAMMVALHATAPAHRMLHLGVAPIFVADEARAMAFVRGIGMDKNAHSSPLATVLSDLWVTCEGYVAPFAGCSHRLLMLAKLARAFQ